MFSLFWVTVVDIIAPEEYSVRSRLWVIFSLLSHAFRTRFPKLELQ